jgi:hypothetical protein
LLTAQAGETPNQRINKSAKTADIRCGFIGNS